MNKIQKIALCYILLMLIAGYSYSVGRFKIFPHDYIESVVQNYQEFAKGDPLEQKSSVASKIKNDLGISWGRWGYSYPAHAVDNARPLEHPDLEERDDLPSLFIDEEHKAGYRVIAGALLLEDSFWGALLLNPEGKVIHTWKLSGSHIQIKAKTDRLINIYGLQVFPDGSVIFNTQEKGGAIVKVDACSNVVWRLEGSFHHTISPDESGYFWSFIGHSAAYDQNMVKISQETGEIVQTIDMEKVRQANPGVNIWNLTLFGNQDTGHITHGNDIEPLPSHLAADFPGFEPGDLVISYATTNLTFVLNPETLEVKWWRAGISDFHHDPDWEAGGKISIYSNNSQRSVEKFSDIVTINPQTMEHEVTLQGADMGFMSDANGRHQLTPYGTRYVTSSKQGWAFETDEKGKIVSSFVNTIAISETKALHLSEASRLKESYFDEQFWLECSG